MAHELYFSEAKLFALGQIFGRFVVQIGLPKRPVNYCVYHKRFSPSIIPAGQKYFGPFNRASVRKVSQASQRYAKRKKLYTSESGLESGKVLSNALTGKMEY